VLQDGLKSESGFGLRLCYPSLPRSPNLEAAFAAPRHRQGSKSLGDHPLLGESAGGLYTEMYLAYDCLGSGWRGFPPAGAGAPAGPPRARGESGLVAPMRKTYATLLISRRNGSGHHGAKVFRRPNFPPEIPLEDHICRARLLTMVA
jgi:hypothetical protein